MGIIHDLDTDDPIAELFDRVKALERNAPTRNSSVTQGLFQFYGGKLLGMAGAVLEWIGTILFTGSVTTSGPFSNTGPFTNSGPFSNSGKFTNSGELEQNGPTRLVGGVDIVGLTRLLNNLLVAPGGSITVEDGPIVVRGGGKIEVGNLTLTPGGGFGGQIDVGGVGVLYLNAVNVVSAGDFTGKNIYASGDINSIGDVTAFGDLIANDDVVVGGQIVNEGIQSKSGVAANVYYDPADSKFKVVI
ncbi:hypothetical protein [Herbiconiux sp. YIM B11900]|uniref:hypothetical protein n=1 Tax=Herbiconiux sp. YIM B11900 TaxID=3404131 RepID=UPI003F831FEF